MAKKTVLICDFCGKNTEPTEGGLPYHKGWIYIHTINGKVEKDKIRTASDKHLCGKQCILNFMDKFFDRKIAPKEEMCKDGND